MKKSILILGAFTLFLAAPTYAQEKAKENKTTYKAKEKKQEVSKVKVRNSKEELIAKPQLSTEVAEPATETKIKPKQVRKTEAIRTEKIRTAKPLQNEK